tara:strand:+ start:1071 stop:1538 length:468 start_codon:yes stop_codon:yes gene_type:complete
VAKLTKIFTLSITEWLIILEAWFAFLKWDLLISFTQYDKWRNKIYKAPKLQKARIEEGANLPEQVKSVIALSEAVGRNHIRKMNCLRRCLTQKQLLAKRGFETCMHIGVNIENDKLKAHAWLSYQGKVINDNDSVNTRYSELKSANEHTILSSLK